MTNHWPRLLQLAEAEVRETVRRLPTPLRTRAQALPVTYEPQAGSEWQDDGVASDTLGLFVGEELAETGATLTPLPAQIILFLESLWDYADEDVATFREEVRATYLHELGHYLGLDEIDLDERGLG